MKKTVLVLTAALLLTGCAKKNNPAPEGTSTPSMAPTMTPSASEQPQAATGLTAILNTIKNNEKFELPMGMDVDEIMLSEVYGLSSEQVKDFAIFMPAMNVHATEIIMVEAQDGKLEEVKKALNTRMENIEQTWSTYLPAQYELVKNRKTVEKGNTIAIIIADQADQIAEEITESLNAAGE